MGQFAKFFYVHSKQLNEADAPGEITFAKHRLSIT